MEKNRCCSMSRQNLKTMQVTTNRERKLETKKRMREKMVFIPGGTFKMGSEDQDGFPADGEGPIRDVTVDPFYIDAYAVTNAEFKAFIEDTGYVTDAEEFGWSFVFHLLVSSKTKQQVTQTVAGTPWWLVVEGADWAHPEGPDSS